MKNVFSVGLISAALMFTLSECNSSSNKGSSTEAPLKYSANTLMRKFEKNAAKYDTLLLGKALQLKGTIHEIELGALGKTVFVIQTKSKDGARIKCEMLSDDTQFEPGNEVCILGFYKEFSFDITLDKCMTCNSVNRN